MADDEAVVGTAVPHSSTQGSLYHWIIGAIGFVSAIGISLIAVLMLLTAFTSRRR
jgi:hypothetical protein